MVKFNEKCERWEASSVQRRLLHGIGIALLVSGGISLALAVLPGAARFDLIGMLRELALTNDQIAQTNERILTTLEAIEGRARSVDRMAEQLGQLQLQVATQREYLARLEGVTAEQAALGKQLATLASSVGPRATHMAQVAKEEVALVRGLQAQTGALSAPLKRIRTANESLNRKLQEAERRSGAILAAMP
jgi:chromosome segregation ATPase